MIKIYMAIIVSLSVLLMTSCAPEEKQATKGKLTLDSTPQGAEVVINSEKTLKKQTPLSVNIDPGTYLIKMSKENYLPVWKYVTVKVGKETNLNLTLPQVRSSVLITSVPPGAKVTIDGKGQGITPLVLTELKPGEYSAQIELLNRATRSVKWEINDSRPKKIAVLLESNVGKLILNSEPAQARVFIDDKACGFTPYQGELSEGRHNLKLSLSGFSELKTTVDITCDQNTKENFKLVSLPGSFKFASSPEAAVIYINDKSFGKTPLTIDDLPAGKYKIRVEKDGFDSISRDADIIAGRVNAIEFTLQRNTGGIDLIVNPPGVSVYVDGKSYGMTVEGEHKDLSKVITIRNLQAGKYQIMLAHKRMMPPTKKYWITVRKAQITRPQPINVWIANTVLKVKDEPQKNVLLLSEGKTSIVYSPEPGVKIKQNRSGIELIRPLTEQDQQD